MIRHVGSYQCEWQATLEDPERLRRFRTFVNADQPDPDIVMVTDRGQPRPAPSRQRIALGSRS
jgi:nitrite reductase (NADH) large subunit